MLKTLELIQSAIKNYEKEIGKEPQTLKEAEKRVQSLIMQKKVKEVNDTSRFNAYKRVIKKVSPSRPILKKSIIDEEGFQIFTNSYEFYKIKNKIVGSEIHTDEISKSYPKTDTIIKYAIERCCGAHTINVKKLKEILSTKNKVDQYYQFNNINLLASDLKNVIDILGFKNKEDIVIKYNPNNSNSGSVVVFKDEDIAIVMSVKVNS